MKSTIMREAPIRIDRLIGASENRIEEDSLGLLPYARALAEFIEDCDTPMTIGVQGDWGSGKTSLLNMLRGDESSPRSGLLPKSSCQIVNFETWSYAQFNQDELLPLTCLYALTKLVDRALDAHRPEASQKGQNALGGAASRLLNVIKTVKVQSLSVGGVQFGMTQASAEERFTYNDIPEEMIRFRKEFRELVKEWTNDDPKKRVVIFIDDLDRVKPLRALELLEAVKNFIDVEGCVFVLAVDYEIVQQGMIEKLGRDVQKTSGKSFFDKIIQLPFTMPSASYDLEAYVMDLLTKARLPYIDGMRKRAEERQFFKEITLCTIGPNPRSIKRVANYVKLLETIRRKSTDRKTYGDATKNDAKCLYSLICMQIAWPELFNHFCKQPTSDTISSLENWDYLKQLPEAQRLFERVHDVEATKNNIATFVDRFFELVDTNQDGRIGPEEMRPVQKVLEMSKLTGVEIKKRPRDFIADRGMEHGAGTAPEIVDFIKGAFRKSQWYTNTELEYRKSGNRYVTLVWKRRQLGTIVSMKTRPFVIRVAVPSDLIVSRMAGRGDGMPIDAETLASIVRPLNDNEQNLTGFGETVIDALTLAQTDHASAVKLLDEVFRIASDVIETDQE